ncbi:MAG: thiamine phosphate synthase [Actinomycetota bacterium]
MTFEPFLYLVAPAKLTAGDLGDLVPELIDAGVDLIQLREKETEAGDLLRLADPILAACREAGVPFVLNDRPDVALALGADGVHVGQNDLPIEFTRRFFGEGIVGLSTHAPGEVDRALNRSDLIDYLAVGPCYETPTKPGRPAAGLELVGYVAELHPELPWFAIGGINDANLDEVMAAGARRIVVVRAITESPDPLAAAAELKQRLLNA